MADTITSELPSSTHPRLAPRVIGHGPTINHLQQAFEQGRLPHGLLLTGPKGIGKATLAHAISRALLDQSMDTLGQSTSSLSATHHLLRAGNHPDFLCVEKTVDGDGKISKDISVDAARSVLDFYSQTSLQDNWRICIIDSVEDLTSKGANSLLKILEEPPAKCLLILIAHNLEAVLPTLRSRSQIFPLTPLSPSETAEVFSLHHADQGDFLSQVSAGRPGLGLIIQALGGRDFYTSFIRTMGLVAKGDMRAVHPFIEERILKSAFLSGDQGWQHFCTFITHWVPHALTQSLKHPSDTWGVDTEASTARSLFSTKRSDKWTDSWFYIQDLIQTAHIYSLDRKQTLSCVFYELAGLYQR